MVKPKHVDYLIKIKCCKRMWQLMKYEIMAYSHDRQSFGLIDHEMDEWEYPDIYFCPFCGASLDLEVFI